MLYSKENSIQTTEDEAAPIAGPSHHTMGYSQVGKAPVFGIGIPRFES